MSPTRLEVLQTFLADDPDDSFNHYAIALEYVSLKQYDNAIKKFQELITLDQNYVPAYHQLGLLLGSMGRKDEALRTFEQGIQIAALVGDTHAQQEMQEAMDALDDN